MRTAGSETMQSLGTSHQESRLTHLHTGLTTGPATDASSRQTCSPVSQVTSAQGKPPERQAPSASRHPNFPAGQDSFAGTTPSSTNPVGPRDTSSSNRVAHLSCATNRQPSSVGLNSSVTTSSPAKPVGNADSGQVLSTSGEMHLLPAAAAEGCADSSQASSLKTATWQSSAQLPVTPGRDQRALSPVRAKGLLPSQPMGIAGASRQMLSPSRDRGISPAKHTDLQKQNDALRFKLQVSFVYESAASCLTMRHKLPDWARSVMHGHMWQMLHDQYQMTCHILP